MIAQGTDGVSRGNLKEGVSVGEQMLELCPWARSALEAEPYLKYWITDWMGQEVEFLEQKDWYERGHDLKGGHVD